MNIGAIWRVHSVAWKPERHHYELLCDPDIADVFRNPWHYSADLLEILGRH